MAGKKLMLPIEGERLTGTLRESSARFLLTRPFPPQLNVFRETLQVTIESPQPGSYIGTISVLPSEREPLREVVFKALHDGTPDVPDDFAELERLLDVSD
jgi:hypothetical protein